MATPNQTLQVRVRSVSHEAEGILGFELVALPPDRTLPPFTAGAHIDLHLPGGLVRSYSLLGDPGERHRYRIGVNRDPNSRGGSRYLHDGLRPGDILTIGRPRNNFPLDESAPCNVFIAGGIGITPILSMIARCRTLGIPWTLYYAARSHQHAGFQDLIAAQQDRPGTAVHPSFGPRPAGRRLNLAAVVAALPGGAHVYCCGPLPMLETYEQATRQLPPARVHREYFAAREAAHTAGGFSIALARSGKTLDVRPGQSILECLIEANCEPPNSCREGVCGTCEVAVLEGTPDHRDLVLTDAEKAAGDRMMVCCSGARSACLVLDL